MTADEAATSLARFANITGKATDDYGRLGSVIVDLGNNFATTESEIVAMGMRLASAGKLAGLTEPEIMALAAAMSSVGIEAEAGGYRHDSRPLNANMKSAVATGWGRPRGVRGRIAGMSSEEFSSAVEERRHERPDFQFIGRASASWNPSRAQSTVARTGRPGSDRHPAEQ